MNDTIALFGSARRDGNTGKLMDWIAAALNIDIVDLSEKELSPYDYDHKNQDDDFVPLMHQLLEHRNIIFASPVYWYAASTQMKIFIDRTSDFLDLEELKPLGRQLRGKTAYVVCTSISKEADSSFLNAFKSTFEYLGMNHGGHVHANCVDGYDPSQYQKDVDRFLKRVSDSPQIKD